MQQRKSSSSHLGVRAHPKILPPPLPPQDFRQKNTSEKRIVLTKNAHAKKQGFRSTKKHTKKRHKKHVLNDRPVLVIFMKSMWVLLNKCQDCEVEGGIRWLIDLQSLIPLRTGVRQLRRSIGKSRIFLVVFTVNIEITTLLLRRSRLRTLVIAAYEASSRNLQQVIEDIRRQVRSLPSSNEQTQSVIRRKLASYRNSLDATMRRVTTVESNVHTLNGMNNRVMAQLADIEGHVDDAADMIQVAQVTTPLPDRDTGSGHRRLPLGMDMVGIPIFRLGQVGALA